MAFLPAAATVIGWGITWGQVYLTAAAAAATAYSSYRTQRKQKEMQNRMLTNSGGGFSASEFYAYSGISTVWDAMGRVIPVVLGTHRTGPMRVQSYTKREGGIDVWYGLFAVSMGEVSNIRDVELNGESIVNFSSASYEIRKGTSDQTAIDWFKDVNTQYTQSGKRVLSTTQITYTVANNCDKLRIRFNMPHGYGTIFSTTYAPDGGNFVNGGYPYPHHVSAVTITSSGMTTVVADPFNYVGGNTAPVNFEIEITGPFTAGQVLYFAKPYTWGTGDHDGESYNNIGGPGTITIYDYIEIAHVVETIFGAGEGYTYPDVALIGVRCPATNTLTREPETTVICDGVLCTLPGYLDTPTFSKNPCAQLYTCMTSTLWGAGKYYKAANFEEWVTATNYFDAMISDGAGGIEKRMETNLVLDSQFGTRELREMFGKLTGSRVFRIRGKYRWFLDIPQTVPAMLFCDGNIAPGSLTWTSSDSTTLFESIAVRFRDEVNGYEERVIEIPYTEGSTDKVPQLTTDLFGITKLSRATHMAIRLLREARLRDGTVKLKGNLDSIACEPGNLVYLGDKEQEQISTGNIVGFGTDYVVLPEPLTFTAGSNYDIVLMLKSGAVATLHVLMTGAAPKNMSGVTSEIVFITTTFAILGSEPRDHSPYSFGLSANAKEDYLCHSVRRTGVKDIEVSLVNYADVWSGAESAIVTDTTALVAFSGNQTPQQVTNLTLRELLATGATGEIVSNMIVSFTPPQDSPGWHHARVYYNQVYDDQPVVGYQYYGDSTGQIVIPNVPVGNTLGIIVQSVSGSGLYASYDDAPEETITPAGIAGTPEDVTGLIALQQGSSVLLQWTDSDEVVTRSYEVRRGLTWGGAATIYTGEPNEFRDWNVTNDTYRYWIAGVSSDGTYSSNKASATVTVQNVPTANIVFERSEYDDDWTGTTSYFRKVSDGLGGNILTTYNPNVATGGTASAITGNTRAALAFDGDTSTRWYGVSSGVSQWVKYDLGAGNEKTANAFRFCKYYGGPTQYTAAVIVAGSNDNSNWTNLEQFTLSAEADGTWQTCTLSTENSTAYRYYRFYFSMAGGIGTPSVYEIQIYEYATTGTATYTTQPFDLTRVDSAYFWLLEDADWQVNNGTWADYYAATDTWLAAFDDATEPWTEIEASGTYTLQQRFSEDNVTWSEWATYSYGTYTARYVQYRIIATIDSATMYLTVRDLTTMIDVEDVIVRIPSVNIAAAGTTLTYANYTDTQSRTAQFYSAPTVNVQIQDATTSLAPVVTNNSTTGCTIHAYNASNVAESAVASVLIQGY